MNCRPQCVTECPPVTSGTRCAKYRKELEDRIAFLSKHFDADVPHHLQKLGVPGDVITALRGKRSPTKALEGAKRFIASPRELIRTLVLVGPRGTGKSVAAGSVLWEWAKHHEWNAAPSGGKQSPPAAWVSAAEVTAVTDFGRVNPDWLEGLKATRVLVVDDLGEDCTQVGLSALADLLKHRHEKKRVSVVTSNLAPNQFRERYGDSWYERLKVAAIVPDLRTEKSLRKRFA